MINITNQKGFASVGLIIALIVIIIGVAGWWVLNSQSNTPTVHRPNTSSPDNITSVSFNWKQDNIYIVRAGEAIKIPKDAYTDDEYLIHVFSVANDEVGVEIKPLGNIADTQELIIKQNETGSFLWCPSFAITPTATTNDTVTLSVKLIPCTL